MASIIEKETGRESETRQDQPRFRFSPATLDASANGSDRHLRFGQRIRRQSHARAGRYRWAVQHLPNERTAANPDRVTRARVDPKRRCIPTTATSCTSLLAATAAASSAQRWISISRPCAVTNLGEDFVTRGRFITFEGTEGVGKTTNMDFVARTLPHGESHSFRTREPGGTPMAERVRAILLDPQSEPIDPGGGAVTRVRRACATSCSCHQAGARSRERGCSAIDSPMRPTRIRAAAADCRSRGSRHSNSEVQGALQPDLTIYLDLPIAVGPCKNRRRHSATVSNASNSRSSSACVDAYLDRAKAACPIPHDRCGSSARGGSAGASRRCCVGSSTRNMMPFAAVAGRTVRRASLCALDSGVGCRTRC